MMDPDALDELASFDAIYFGAVGSAEVPDHVTLWGLRLEIVQGFDQAISLRPAKLLPGIRGPLRDRGADDVDLVVVRENTEGEYSGIGGFSHRGLPSEVAQQTAVYTRAAIERTARFAFELARTRPARRVTSVTKSNASPHASVLWDQRGRGGRVMTSPRCARVAAGRCARPRVWCSIPARSTSWSPRTCTATSSPTSRGALAGSLGMAPSANLHLDGRFPSMFEPVHGSALDLVGRGIANPIGAILSAAMMLDELGSATTAALVCDAVAETCAGGICTPDVGGAATSAQVGDAVIAAIQDRLAATAEVRP